MRIGTGKRNPATGNLEFTIVVPFAPAFTLEAVPVAEPKERGPAYDLIFAGGRAGALWKYEATAERGAYMNGQIESPVFPAGKLQVSVFPAKETTRPGESDMTWRLEQPRQSQAPAPAGSATNAAAARNSAPGDDDIPF
jgi:hypothetical protein